LKELSDANKKLEVKLIDQKNPYEKQIKKLSTVVYEKNKLIKVLNAKISII